MSAYCAQNLLAIQPLKTVYLNFHNHFSIPDSSPLIRLNTQSIARASSVPFLGLTISESLDWSIHIDKVCGKIKSGCYLLRRMKRIVNPQILRLIYYAHVHSHIIWFFGGQRLKRRVFRHQKRAIRIMAGTSWRKSCRDLFPRIYILTLTNCLIQSCAQFVRMNPDLFPRNNATHSHSTRSRSDIHVLAHNTSRFSTSPTYLCLTIYNKLPLDTKNAQSLGLYQSKLKKFLQKNCYYTVNEFLCS